MSVNIRDIVQMTIPELMKWAYGYLQSIGYTDMKVTPDYIYAEGELPIILVAHMDTVAEKPPEDLMTTPENILFAPGSVLGGDDRAGVYSVLYIATHTKVRPYIILTTGEEHGGIGAHAAAKELKPKGLHYAIELDRRGENDAVFYDLDSKEFEEFATQLGFKTAIGSFSDIGTLCPAWNCAGVNFSIGFNSEHTDNEKLNLKWTKNTINMVLELLKIPSKHFKFKAKKDTYRRTTFATTGTTWAGYGGYDDWGYPQRTSQVQSTFKSPSPSTAPTAPSGTDTIVWYKRKKYDNATKKWTDVLETWDTPNKVFYDITVDEAVALVSKEIAIKIKNTSYSYPIHLDSTLLIDVYKTAAPATTTKEEETEEEEYKKKKKLNVDYYSY